ncbi:hypothetical protein JTE90_011196 [Oedothorax gibbosus]|uniref:Uncharacterized protein n=1 Tax=Oedothorax gibbosus TaxID=931172 RepID=A0AAV6W286_9ARAC|nr:hypothetical protein JTE90_011196 [Oedothorax gibbosus]
METLMRTTITGGEIYRIVDGNFFDKSNRQESEDGVFKEGLNRKMPEMLDFSFHKAGILGLPLFHEIPARVRL